ncbi:hypothetical protein P8452_07778 [Trifolium repens]|nr:hypothetical protein P8452_07778 [Trifolium repens]
MAAKSHSTNNFLSLSCILHYIQIGKSRGFWSIFVPPVTRKPDLEPDVDSYENYIEQSTPNVGVVDQESNEIHRFELLRSELMELEKRVQRSTYQSENNEVHLNI